MALNLDLDIDVCDSCGLETKVEPELLVNPFVYKAIDASTVVYDGWEAMYPLLCKDCAMKTFTSEGRVAMFEKLRKKGVTVTKFRSMSEISNWYVQPPRPDLDNKIPEEKAVIKEPTSRW